MQYSILWIININKKHGCAREANRLQIGCTGYVNIAAVWMMENNGCVYSLLN